MDFPKDLKYSRTHEWVKLEGKEAVIGITAYASDELGDIVYVELPEDGEDLEKDTAFGVVESVKATADLYAPLSGKVVETNEPLEDAPEVMNEDPYGDGWMLRLALADASELDELMDANAYHEFVEEERES
ncbi:MAG TPA: glycine cleavage system protein GcvH [bacterium]|nr:glycine cleavage system protein GcvH [bacterium]